IRRTPGVLEKIFTESERRDLSAESLAVRFAAKEAIAKALGVPTGMNWHNCSIETNGNGRPGIRTTGTVKATADAQGVTAWHVSLTHDGGVSSEYVIAENTSS